MILIYSLAVWLWRPFWELFALEQLSNHPDKYICLMTFEKSEWELSQVPRFPGILLTCLSLKIMLVNGYSEHGMLIGASRVQFETNGLSGFVFILRVWYNVVLRKDWLVETRIHKSFGLRFRQAIRTIWCYLGRNIIYLDRNITYDTTSEGVFSNSGKWKTVNFKLSTRLKISIVTTQDLKVLYRENAK